MMHVIIHTRKDSPGTARFYAVIQEVDPASHPRCVTTPASPHFVVLFYREKKNFLASLIGFISPTDALLQKFDLLTTSAPLSINLKPVVMYLLGSLSPILFGRHLWTDD